MGDGDLGSGLMYGADALLAAVPSAFLFLPFFAFLPALPCGELPGLEPLE